ncbi:UDP-3-O-(3-hydroxymyristoyl)glucosamine N-acyltransferase [Sedimentibacter sp.]|uniref:UDP-3-O-(3-hydroxymyristoyl)glucosamine N-acyltransferase n=1 Tax=Sedimentibacter sp. TaxID=1960295 RepID=UPI0028984E55|nr:UDP-3-O-(3-hydroxymyristoyl)glucosamine N-acyltransferase [Sedimentibacter sp.]
MLLSEILKDMKPFERFEIVNEKQFDCLALIASNVDKTTCVFLDSEKFISSLKSNVSMVITNRDISKKLDCSYYGICIVESPRIFFFMVHNYINEKNELENKKTDALIGNNCTIHKLSSIAEYNVKIGDNVIIEEFVVIRENTIVGNNSIIRAGSIIGGQGYEFKRVKDDILKVAHAGGVIIGENVEIQYNTCIDRGVYSWDNTIIGDNCKIDNLVHIAHGVKIGKNTMVVANAGIGGRTIIGENAWIGFASTIINGVIVGNSARANIGSVVTKSIPNEGSFSGNFAIEHSIFMKNLKKSILDNEE